MNSNNEKQTVIVELNFNDDSFNTSTIISDEILEAERELEELNDTISSTQNTILRGDKTDYSLAVGSGILCGAFDIFFVGAPQNNSLIEEVTDKWVNDIVDRIASLNGWSREKYKSSSIKFLERIYKVPYDQRGCGDAGKEIFELNPSNHHFKSLGHQPSLIGLMFSIIDQFTNQSHFVTNGQLVALEEANGKFKLRGKTFIGKLFCGFANWFFHIISDISGSSSSKGRGMGIPSPIWSWINSIIVLKTQIGLSGTELDKKLCIIAEKVYLEGVDFRFTLTQSFPVVINELIVRLFFSLRRFIQICKNEELKKLSINDLWLRCKPFKQPILIRMLTIAHGTFCAIDICDATIRAYIKGLGNFQSVEFFVRLNVVGICRLTISLLSEIKLAMLVKDQMQEKIFLEKKLRILEDYVNGLKQLSSYYNDKNFFGLVNLFREKINTEDAFIESIRIAKERGVETPLKTKEDIDNFFIV